MFGSKIFLKIIRYVCAMILALLNIIDDMFLKVTRYIMMKTIQQLEKEEQKETVDTTIEMNVQFLKNDLLYLERKNYRMHQHILKCILYRSVYVNTEIYGLTLFSLEEENNPQVYNINITNTAWNMKTAEKDVSIIDINNNKIAWNIETTEKYVSIIRLHVPCVFKSIEFTDLNFTRNDKTLIKLFLNDACTETYETTINKRKHFIYNTSFLLDDERL